MSLYITVSPIFGRNFIEPGSLDLFILSWWKGRRQVYRCKETLSRWARYSPESIEYLLHIKLVPPLPHQGPTMTWQLREPCVSLSLLISVDTMWELCFIPRLSAFIHVLGPAFALTTPPVYGSPSVYSKTLTSNCRPTRLNSQRQRRRRPIL